MAWDASSLDAIEKALNVSHSQPGSIKKACRTIEDYLVSNKDNLRAFFERCFPILLKRVFGYDDMEVSWLNIISKSSRQDDAQALVQLLSPEGLLFQAMHSSDEDQLIQFRFPPERLPAHTQELLRTAGGRLELDSWPQYRGRLVLDAAGRCSLNLNLFEYFFFWNAFYVLRGSRAADTSAAADQYGSRSQRAGQQLMAGLRYGSQLWGSGASSSSGSSSSIKQSSGDVIRHPYYKLLRLHLEHYLPRLVAANKGKAGAAGTGALSSSFAGDWGGAGWMGAGRGLLYLVAPGAVYVRPGEVLWSVLLEFWLTDAAEPLPPDPPATNRAGSPPLAYPTAAGAAAAAGLGAAAGLQGFSSSSAGATGPAGGSSPGVLAGGALVAAGSPLMSGVSAASPGTAGAATAPLLQPGTLGHVPSTNPLRAVISSPPAEELVAAVTHLARYMYVREPQQPDAVCGPAQDGSSSWLPLPSVQTYPPPSSRLLLGLSSSGTLGGASGSPAVQAVARKLYRFMRRGLAAWQPNSSVSLTPLLRCLLVVVAPWRAMTWEDTRSLHSFRATSAGRELLANQVAAATATLNRWGSGLQAHLPGSHSAGGSGSGTSGGAAQQRQQQGTYSGAWRPHVLAHLPFYCVLVPQLLQLCGARMAVRPDSALRDAYNVLRELQLDPALVEELAAAEAAVNRYLAGRSRGGDADWGDLPAWWAEQLKDWEAAAAAGQATTPAVIPVTCFSLFSIEEAGPAWCMRDMLAAAHSHGISTRFRDQIEGVAHQVLPLAELPADEGRLLPTGPQPGMDHFPQPGDWRRLAYKGDPLLRPIASYELSWLAKALVHISVRANHAMGLTGVAQTQHEEPPETLVEEWLRVARRRGWRVNLRPLAEKQLLFWVLLLSLVVYVVRAIVATSGLEEPAGMGHGSSSSSSGQHAQHPGAALPSHTQQQYGHTHPPQHQQQPADVLTPELQFILQQQQQQHIEQWARAY